MADKITQDDIDNAAAIEAILSNTARTRQDLLDLILKQIDGQKKLSEILDKELGKQAQFLTNAEIESRLKEDRIAILEKELSIALEIEELQKQKTETDANGVELLTKEADLRAEIASLRASTTTASSAEYRELQRKEQKLQNILDAQEQQQKQLDKINQKITDNSTLVTGDVNNIRLKIKAQSEEKKNLDQISTKQKDIRGIIGNQIEQTLGLKDATDSMGDALIDAVFNAREQQGAFVGNFKEEIKQIYEALGLEMKERLAAPNVFKNLKARAADFTDDFADRMKQLARQFVNMPIAFQKQTGFSRKLGEEFKSLSKDLNKSGFLIEETDAAFNSLTTGFNKFTIVGEEVRKQLTEDAALMNRLGVDTATYATSIENLTTGMGMGAKAASDFSQEMVAFGTTIGLSANKVLQELNQNFDILATYGKDKGAEVFKELAKTAKAAGIEMQQLISIGKKFDTFEGAMKSAGKLNFILGGPLVNSMEMLNATEERRIEILRESLKASGKSFEDLGRRGKEALANTLGISVAVAERLFNDENIKSIEEANEAINGSTMSLEELRKQGYENLTQEQRRELAQQQQITTNETLLNTFEKIDEIITQLHETFMPLLSTIGALGLVFGTLSSIISFATGLMTVFGIEGTLWGALTSAAWGPVTLTILGIAAAIAIVAGLFSWLGVTGEDVANALVAAFEFMGEAIKVIFQGVALVILGVLEIIAHAIIAGLTSGLSILFAGIAEVLSYIPGMGDIADAMQAFSPHHLIRGVFDDAYGSVMSFQTGTNYAPGGMSLVGEAGPELMSVPQGAGITPAEQTERMMSTLQTFNNIMTSPNNTENVNSVVNNTNNVVNNATQAAARNQNLNMNIVLKIDEREISRISKEVSMDVMQKSLEVSA